MTATEHDIEQQLTAFGAKLRYAREKVQGWTRPAMFRATGISDSTIVRAERGDRIRLDTLLAVAGAVGVDVPAAIVDALTPTDAEMDAIPAEAPSWFLEYVDAAEERHRLRHEELLASLDNLTVLVEMVSRRR